ncbi:MAG: hypothetical protein VYB14_07670, partial [Planctomycetota bacterium]|nr:hypothetical protein [Planctomycetota bacterium]
MPTDSKTGLDCRRFGSAKYISAKGNANNSGEGAQLAEDGPRPDTTAAYIIGRNAVIALVELVGVRL